MSSLPELSTVLVIFLHYGQFTELSCNYRNAVCCCIYYSDLFHLLLVLTVLQLSVLSNDDVCTAVFEQWLVADLSEIGAVCLPSDVINQQKYMLTGCYGLQVSNTC